MSENLAIIVDGRPLRTYPLGGAGFHGGTETAVRRIAHGLAERGHIVHVLTSDLAHEEMRGPTEWWWGPANHPQVADVVIAIHSLETIGDLSAPLLVMLPNGIDPPLYDRGDMVDAWVCFSETHVDLLTKARPVVLRDRCYVTGLGVDLADYPKVKRIGGGQWAGAYDAVKGRMLYGNDPARGLWHVLDVFDKVKAALPEASLHVAYDFDRQFEAHRWNATSLAEVLWECKRRIELTDGVTSLGAVSSVDLLREQMECHVHVYPSDPPNIGSQIHGMLQMELAAAGVPLVLSDVEAFPEVFGEAATILPLPGTMRKAVGNDMLRVDAQDWADETLDLMCSPKRWKAASAASRKLAEQHTWDRVLDNWQALLARLVAGMNQPAEEIAQAA